MAKILAERINCSVIVNIQFVRMQDDEDEQPSSFHKSEASNMFFSGKDQMSLSAFRVQPQSFKGREI